MNIISLYWFLMGPIYIFSAFAIGSFIFAVSVSAQDQSGFISIDCGIPDDSSYNDEKTGIKYVSDKGFVESGITKSISADLQTTDLERQFYSVRSFPVGAKNCYTIKPPRGKGFRYLIRTRFMYGNYDGLSHPPEFDLYLGPNLWTSILLDNTTAIVSKEIINLAKTDNLNLCLVDKGKGTPFMSVLELRLLKNDMYDTPNEAIMLNRRWDLGSTSNLSFRYSDDAYDRIWKPLNFNPDYYKKLSSAIPMNPNNNNVFQPASVVMTTATARINASDPVIMVLVPEDPKTKYYLYMHFAEVEVLNANQTREFQVFLNDKPFDQTLVRPRYMYTDTLYFPDPVNGTQIEFSLVPTAKSNLPPIINALETYMVNEFLQLPTDQENTDAMYNIKNNYKVKKIWQGDPCTPQGYSWDGLNCSFPDQDSPKIIALNLSATGLSGQIDISFSNLTMIESLDLSNNSLTGPVPEFLSDLQYLRVLNLEGNKLTGSLPVKLIERSNNGSLLLRVGGNPDLCLSTSCQTTNKKKSLLVPVIASVAAFLLLSAALPLLFWFLNRRKKNESGKIREIKNGLLQTRNRYYTYAEIVKITNSFETVLGRGGFGTVYSGFLDNTQVAVKMLSSSSTQGYKEFRSEVELLMRVHHINLTSLIGYCNEGEHMGLIYEYMANGNLGDILSGKSKYVLSWEERLQISLDAAQGLEYLHHGCKPPIVHRDVKPANILLNEKFQAKIADFGLSRSFPIEGGSHVSTVVAGTIGYLDPEYSITNRLNEKSDVYSFGVVLLEIITGLPVIVRSRTENTHITDRVSSIVSRGDIKGIVDPKVGSNFDSNSAWKITELALVCASRNSAGRPTMGQVFVELKECLVRETAQRSREQSGDDRNDPRKMTDLNLGSEMRPQPR